MESDTVLFQLEQDIEGEDVRRINPLPVDRWIASSVMRKSIRRGDVITAKRTALTFWEQDKQGFWRRIHLIACEDVGVASPEAVTKVLTALNNSAWRKGVGDLRVALHLVRLLCEAIKIRLADEIYSLADKSPEYNGLRETLARASNRYLAGYTLDQDRPIAERCLALWFLAGTKRYPSDNLPQHTGSLDVTAKVLRSVGAPPCLTESCIGALPKSQYPLALWTPLLWTELKRQPRTLVTWADRFTVSTMYKGIPVVALDGFTRVGKTAFRKLQHAAPEFKGFTTQQIALAVFYSEGWCLDNRLTCVKLDATRKAGEMADLAAAGLDAPRYAELRDHLARHAGTLEVIRLQELKTYLDGSRQQFALKFSHE